MRLDGWELVFFYLFGGWTLVTGLATIVARNPVHSAVALVSSLVSTAGLFVLLRAELLAGAQVLVYVGGVMVLFLFVIMLVAGPGDERSRGFTRLALAAAVLVASLAAAFSFVAAGASPLFAPPEPRVAAAREATVDRAGEPLSRNAERMADELFGRAALPFEIASLVLLVAIVGAVHLARERSEERISD